jgi:hypothetical protein
MRMKASNKVAEKGKATATTSPGVALAVEKVVVDASCIGSRWTAADLHLLARIIAIIAMGQAAHAARIVNALVPAEPAIDDEGLRANAKQRLTVTGTTDEQKQVRRYHRDGLIFEAISWIAAQQQTGGNALLRDPHVSATTQGLDGLMIEMDAASAEVKRATIFEDKCSENPDETFRYKIMPAFKAHHANKRASDLVATAAALLQKVGLNGTDSVKAAARVLDKAYRTYRGSLAVTTADDSVERRQSVFKTYGELDGINPDQRIGAVLITSENLRDWFDSLADRAIAYIDELDKEAV